VNEQTESYSGTVTEFLGDYEKSHDEVNMDNLLSFLYFIVVSS
jgi:hypothetical protein